MKKKIALIGCTGSVGRRVVETVRRYPDLFSFSVLVNGSGGEELAALKEEFSPRLALSKEGKNEDLFSDCDVAFIAASGFAGLSYTLRAARAGKQIALANKESLVCGGELVLKEIERSGSEMIPVDSEHSAIFQALEGEKAPFSSLVLTASGGPFLHKKKEELPFVTPKEALRHPTYRMGKKISIDSATLLNKGYEVIEAHYLFKADFEKIEVIVHPESVIHSLVRFQDGALKAILSLPDMSLPVQYALTYPKRLPCIPALELSKLLSLHFEPLDREKFPCFSLALEAGKAGGSLPTVLNAAGEVAAKAFLEGRINFTKIAETIDCALQSFPKREADSFETLEEEDFAAREFAERFIS